LPVWSHQEEEGGGGGGEGEGNRGGSRIALFRDCLHYLGASAPKLSKLHLFFPYLSHIRLAGEKRGEEGERREGGGGIEVNYAPHARLVLTSTPSDHFLLSRSRLTLTQRVGKRKEGGGRETKDTQRAPSLRLAVKNKFILAGLMANHEKGGGGKKKEKREGNSGDDDAFVLYLEVGFCQGR